MAVARGLAWLARMQVADKDGKAGHWQYDAARKFSTDMVSATGMALLPFLGAGETHLPAHKYRDVVSRGLEFLLARQVPSGGFKNPDNRAPNMYGQAIAALALIEAYGMTADPRLKPAAQKAVDFIQAAQGENGSWGYEPYMNGDTSIVGWQVQALHAAKLSKGLSVDGAVLKKANAFLDAVSAGPNRATYGYRAAPGAPGASLTAIGLLCRYWENGWGPNNPGLMDGVKGLLAKPPRAGTFDPYYSYYSTQVVHLFGGKTWAWWNGGELPGGGTRDLLISMHVLKDDPAERGSWEADPHLIGRSCGRLGTTAMAVLTLEVYYRHLPTWQRADGTGPFKSLEK